MNYYENALVCLYKDNGEDYNVQTANSVLSTAFNILGEKAFNEHVQGIFDYLTGFFKDNPAITDEIIAENCCEGFQKGFRSYGICDRYDMKTVDVNVFGDRGEILRRDISVNSAVDKLIWDSLNLKHTFWIVLRAMYMCYAAEKRGETPNFKKVWQKMVIDSED